jgi:hypothetical protein
MYYLLINGELTIMPNMNNDQHLVSRQELLIFVDLLSPLKSTCIVLSNHRTPVDHLLRIEIEGNRGGGGVIPLPSST